MINEPLQEPVSDASGSFLLEVARRLLCFRCSSALAVDRNRLLCVNCGEAYYADCGVFQNLPQQEEQVGSWFKERAGEYEQDFGLTAPFSTWIGRRLMAVLRDRVSTPVPFLLDLACGTGTHTKSYKTTGIAKHALGLDVSDHMLSIAAKEPVAGVGFVTGDSATLSFRSDSVDLVVGTSALHHVLELPRCMSEVRRVLVPGSVAVFLEPFYIGNQMLAFLVELASLAFTKSQQYTNEEVSALVTYCRSHSDLIRERFLRQGDKEWLSKIDDKYIFTREHLRRVANEARFTQCILSVHVRHRRSRTWSGDS